MKNGVKFVLSMLAFATVNQSRAELDSSFKFGLGLGVLGIGTHIYCSFYKKKLQTCEKEQADQLKQFSKLYNSINNQKRYINRGIDIEKSNIMESSLQLMKAGTSPDYDVIIPVYVNSIKNSEAIIQNNRIALGNQSLSLENAKKQLNTAEAQLSNTQRKYSRLYYGAFFSEIVASYLIWKSIK